MDVYVKKGRRYVKLGEQWEGFPSDGIWLVWDGTQNCLVQLATLKKFHNLRYWGLTILASFREAIADAIIEVNGCSKSPLEIANLIVDKVWDSYTRAASKINSAEEEL